MASLKSIAELSNQFDNGQSSPMGQDYTTNLTIRRGRPILGAMTALGKIIQDRRIELGLTLAQLSEQTGILPQTINAIERGGSRQPRFVNLHKIAVALEIPVSSLAEAAYSEAVPA